MTAMDSMHDGKDVCRYCEYFISARFTSDANGYVHVLVDHSLRDRVCWVDDDLCGPWGVCTNEMSDHHQHILAAPHPMCSHARYQDAQT